MTRALGTKLEVAAQSIRAYSKPLDAGASNASSSQPIHVTVMQVVISLFALAWGTLIIVGAADANEELRMAACGWVGTVIGYWLG